MRSVKDTVLVLPRRRLRQSEAALSPHHLCTLPGSSVLETEAQRYGSQSQSERCSQRWGGTPKRREPEKAAPAILPPHPPTPPYPHPPGGSQRQGPPLETGPALPRYARSSLSATRAQATRGTPLYSYSLCLRGRAGPASRLPKRGLGGND